MGLEFFEVAHVGGITHNNETVLSSGSHSLETERKVDAACTDRVGNVLIVGLDGWLPPVKVFIGVRRPQIILLQVLVCASDEDARR